MIIDLPLLQTLDDNWPIVLKQQCSKQHHELHNIVGRLTKVEAGETRRQPGEYETGRHRAGPSVIRGGFDWVSKFHIIYCIRPLLGWASGDIVYCIWSLNGWASVDIVYCIWPLIRWASVDIVYCTMVTYWMSRRLYRVLYYGHLT